MKRSTKNLLVQTFLKLNQANLGISWVGPLPSQDSLSMTFSPTLWALGFVGLYSRHGLEDGLTLPFLRKKPEFAAVVFSVFSPPIEFWWLKGFFSFCILLHVSAQVGTVSVTIISILSGSPVILISIHSIRQKSHPQFPSRWVRIYPDFLLRRSRDKTLKHLEALLLQRS